MMNLAEYRRTATQARRLPALGGAGRLRRRLNKDGSFSAPRGFATPIWIPPSRPSWSPSPAAAQQRLAPPGLGLGDLRRGAAPAAATLSRQQFPDAASALVDAERKAISGKQGAHFESSYFLTFALAAAGRGRARAEGWLYEAASKRASTRARLLGGFIDPHRPVLPGRSLHVPECRWLDDGETLTYLHWPSRPTGIASAFPKPDLSRRPARRPALDRRAGTRLGDQHLRAPDHHRLSDRDDARPARRAEPAGLPLPLVEPARSCSTRPMRPSC